MFGRWTTLVKSLLESASAWQRRIPDDIGCVLNVHSRSRAVAVTILVGYQITVRHG